ncbi:MAG: hypothetical protein DRQ47_07240 [Gammaproteobacteria bacterium]|nr:MAG: hypothetical protein DRQ47_07240 [Gammaproteobacteria bacterium]
MVNGGLSALGREAVKRLNRYGVVIDVSQLSTKSLLQTIKLSTAPVIASHSAVRALINETRNLSDMELDAIAANGGVVHVPPFNSYIAPRPRIVKKLAGELRQKYGLPAEFQSLLDDMVVISTKDGNYTYDFAKGMPRASVDDYVDHIDYIVDRIGIDHVGIGTDFNHASGIPGYADESEAINVTHTLLKRDYTAEEIKKIWSGNFMRVFEAVEHAAKK